jgi:hypothetical protein
MNVEDWKKIDGYENYEVSDAGNVRNSKTGMVLKKGIDTHGYCILYLYKNGKRKTERTHRLVGIAFIVNPDNKLCIDHIDNCKTNNNLSNLRWATSQENNINIGIRKNNISGIKGVSYDKRSNKWRARIKIDGINIHIGSYATIKEATKARVKRANEVFGAYTNACEKQ